MSGEGVDLCLGREPGQGVPRGRQGVCRGFRLEVVCTWTKRPQGMPAGPGAVERMTFRSHGGPGGDRTVLPAWRGLPRPAGSAGGGLPCRRAAKEAAGMLSLERER